MLYSVLITSQRLCLAETSITSDTGLRAFSLGLKLRPIRKMLSTEYVTYEIEKRISKKSLRIDDLNLKGEILERLINGAKGM